MKKMILIIMAIIFLIAGLVFICFSLAGCSKSSQLMDAITNDDTEIALELIDSGLNVNRYYPPLILDFLDEGMGELPLVRACSRGNVEIVEALLEHGADPNKHGNECFAAMRQVKGTPETRLTIYKLLVSYGGDVNVYGCYDNALCKELFTLLQSTNDEEYNGCLKIIEYLLDNGAVYYAGENFSDGSVIRLLAVHNKADLIRELTIKYGFDVNYMDLKGYTALIWAAQYGYKETCLALVELGTDKTIKDNTGKTAYDYAVENGYAELAELLKP